MAITINGTGTITGISVGGLNDGIITQPEIATGVAGTGPAFSAYVPASTQSIASGTWTKTTMSAEEFDTANCFDSTTNYRFTPTVSGYYQINGAIYFGTTVATQQVRCSVYKNGTNFKHGNATQAAGTSGAGSVVSAIIYFNGSTDYVELYAYQASGTTQTLYGDAGVNTYFQGALVRAA